MPHTRPTARWWPRPPSPPARTAPRLGARRPGPRKTPPVTGSWSKARSRSQLAQNDPASNNVQAVDANAWASPVQPRRSSRCGQSVGTETKLSRCGPNDVLVEPVQVRVGATRMSPRRGVVLLMATYATSMTSASVSISAYRKPWNVNVGSRRTVWSSAEDVGVGRSCRSERSGMEGSVRLEDLGVPHRDPLSRRPRTRIRTWPVMFWPPSMRNSPGRTSTGDTGIVATIANRRRHARLEDPRDRTAPPPPWPRRVIEFRLLPSVLLLDGDRSPPRRTGLRPGSRRWTPATRRR